MRRKIVLKAIKDVPGINFNEIVRITNLSNGVVSHHILQLLKDNEIIKSEVGRAKYFHHKISKIDIKYIIIFRNNTNYEIAKLFLKSEIPITAKEISKKLDKSASTISVNLKKLEKTKLVGRKILNRNIKLTSDIGFYLLDEEFVNKIFSKYNIANKMNHG